MIEPQDFLLIATEISDSALERLRVVHAALRVASKIGLCLHRARRGRPRFLHITHGFRGPLIVASRFWTKQLSATPTLTWTQRPYAGPP